MRHNRLDLNLLTALKALLTEKSVTRAGESVHVTQSAMSGILARLREYFGDPLIVKVGQKMELTPLAESLVGPVTDVLLRIDTAIATRPEFDPVVTPRHFTVVASDYAIKVLLLDVLREVQRLAPGITVEFRAPGEQAIEDLEAGRVDFIIHPKRFTSPSQPAAILFEDSFLIVADQDHPHPSDTMDLEQYLALGHVGFKSGQMDAPLFESWFESHYGRKRRTEITAHSYLLLAQLVQGTSRIATLHTRLARQYDGAPPVRLITPTFEIPMLIEVLQWHTYRNFDPASVWFRQRIVERARVLSPLEGLS